MARNKTKVAKFFITAVLFGCVNVFAFAGEAEFRTFQESEKPFGWHLRRIKDGEVSVVAKLPVPPLHGSVPRCDVVRSDDKAWLIIYRLAGGVGGIYECPLAFFREDFDPDASSLETLVPVDIEGIWEFAGERKITDCFGEYVLFFEEDGMLKVVPAVFPSVWKSREDCLRKDQDRLARRRDIGEDDVVGYNPNTKTWEKTSTAYRRFEEIGTFMQEKARHDRRCAKSAQIGNFTFTKGPNGKSLLVQKTDGERVSSGRVEADGFPKSFVEVGGELWGKFASPDRVCFLCRIRVENGALKAEKLPFPFRLPQTDDQILSYWGSVMIREGNRPGIIVPLKSDGGMERVFWFDESLGRWTEKQKDGSTKVYDDAAASAEYQARREKNRKGARNEKEDARRDAQGLNFSIFQ